MVRDGRSLKAPPKTRAGTSVAGYSRQTMTTRKKTTALEEIKDVRHALLDLARSLLEVATATIVTAADATFALANDVVARVRKQVQNPGGATTAVAKRSQAASVRPARTARRVAS